MAKKIVTRVNRNLARRLREARREAGLSTRALASKLPPKLAVSHATLASYENGTTVPSIDVLGALADIYQRTLNWFLDERESVGSFRYFNMASRVGVGEQRLFEAKVGKWTEAYLNLDRHLNRPRRFRPVITEQLPPEQLAAVIRTKHLNLDDSQPIYSVVSVLESFSAWALEVRTTFGVDGVAAKRGDAHIVVLNPTVSRERLRMSAAIEVARILYDDQTQFPGTPQLEKASYVFATSLLLPRSQLVEAFDGRSFLKLIQYREKFGLSLAAMIYMAESAKVINTTVARRLWSEVARQGWRQQEPGRIWWDRAISFETMLDCAIQSKQISWSDAERVTGIMEPELRQRIVEVMENNQSAEGANSHPTTLKLAAYRAAE